MLFEYDITFCNDKECPRTDCRRHPTNIPTGIPVSVFLEKYREGEECRWYYGDGREDKK